MFPRFHGLCAKQLQLQVRMPGRLFSVNKAVTIQRRIAAPYIVNQTSTEREVGSTISHDAAEGHARHDHRVIGIFGNEHATAE